MAAQAMLPTVAEIYAQRMRKSKQQRASRFLIAAGTNAKLIDGDIDICRLSLNRYAATQVFPVGRRIAAAQLASRTPPLARAKIEVSQPANRLESDPVVSGLGGAVASKLSRELRLHETHF